MDEKEVRHIYETVYLSDAYHDSIFLPDRIAERMENGAYVFMDIEAGWKAFLWALTTKNPHVKLTR